MFFLPVISETSNKQFADRVKRLMAAKTMDVATLAAKGQLKTPAIYQWLEAKYLPRGENLRKLARVLDVSTAQVLLHRLSSPRRAAAWLLPEWVKPPLRRLLKPFGHSTEYRGPKARA